MKKTITLAALTVSMSMSAQAVTYIWDGSTSTDWDDGTNWAGGAAPVDAAAGNGGLTLLEADDIVLSTAGSGAPFTNVPALGGFNTNFSPGDTSGNTPTISFESGTYSLTAGAGSIGGINSNAAGTRTVFTVGDGLGIADTSVTISLTGSLNRHKDGTTHNFLIHSDGAMIFDSGVDFQFNTNTDRTSTFDIAGGTLLFQGAATGLTIAGNFIDFTAVGGSFTADFGSGSSDYIDLAAVNSALGIDFLNNSGGTLNVVDNGGTFTITAVPEPSSAALLGLGGLALLLRRRK